MVFQDLEVESFYRVLAPRPTILVTTINPEGQVNAAPFSFTMPVSLNPPLLAFASVPTHHTFQNLKETGGFVVNIPTADILGELWITGEKFPSGVNEIEKAGLTEIPSTKVSAPRIAECAAHMECKVFWIKEAGDHHLIVGEVLKVHVNENILKEGLLDVEKVKPILHLGGTNFVVGNNLKTVNKKDSE